ncbi:hypothetical protein PPMP20_18740 [Paraburkholderia phymatum]|nr:hypothetical protein [Paraburkholderia phymatum]
MNRSHVAVIAPACATLVACSRKASLFLLAPNYTVQSALFPAPRRGSD